MDFTFDHGIERPDFFPPSVRLNDKCGEAGRDGRNWSHQSMNAHVATENGDRQPQPQTAVSRAIHWIQDYVDKNPHTQAAREARSIIYGLKAVRQRPSLDELLALIGQIAKSDLGFGEINSAKIRMNQPEKYRT